MPPEDEEYYYTVHEIAQKFRVGDDTVRVWLKMGRMPFIRVGRRNLVAATELTRFVSELSNKDLHKIAQRETA